MSAPFDEEDVADDFLDAIDGEVIGRVGRPVLRAYSWPDGVDDDGAWPFVVERDGRRFEVDIDVKVVELTPELVAKRAAVEAELLARLERDAAARKATR